jgi:hypothetical protein
MAKKITHVIEELDITLLSQTNTSKNIPRISTFPTLFQIFTMLHFACRPSQLQTFPTLRHSYVPEHPAEVEFCAFRNWASIRTVNYACRCKRVMLQFALQHTGNWLGTARPQSRLCYRPTVFSHHHLLNVLSLPQEKIRRAFKKIHYFSLLFKLRNVKLRKLRSVCIIKKRIYKQINYAFYNKTDFPTTCFGRIWSSGGIKQPTKDAG